PFLQKALAINPNLAASLLAIGRYYNHVGKAELALPYFERLQRILSQDDGVKLALAESFDALGRSEQAHKLYGELRNSASGLIPSLYYFARNDLSKGNADLAREIEALQSRETLTVRDRSTLHTALGFIHERSQNYSLAFAHFDKANRLLPIDFDMA